MSLLSSLFVLASSLFGLTLTPPSPSALSLPILAQRDEAISDPVELGSAERAEVAPASVTLEQAQPEGERSDLADIAAQLRQRQEMGIIHRAFGIATWASMLVTVGLGLIQYYNLYGFLGSRDDNPCVNGTAIFGQEQCYGAPWPHRVASLTTTALYATTFALSFAMPDPLGASEGASGADLELHKALRWVHFGGMIAQIFLGFMASQSWFGLDRANHFEALQAIATVHQVVGLATFGALTASAAVVMF